MSLARRMARQAAKKNGNGTAAAFQQLAALGGAIQGLQGIGGDLERLIPEAQNEAQKAVDVFAGLREYLREVEYKQERQRAVFLRMIHNIGLVPIVDAEGFDEILAIEEEYGAEYDAMRFLAWVAMLGRGEDP